jgi:hypothetical protein
MKIALCISGYFTNKNNDNLLQTNYIYDNIINRITNNSQELDIFIHSFDTNSEKNILKKYPNTRKTIIEDQINFINKLSDKNKEFHNLLLKSKYKNGASYDLQETLSMIYSRCKVIKLACEYSSNNNFKYDTIIRVRFDIGVRMKKPHSGFKPDNLIFDLNKYDYNYFYSSYWNQLNAGYADLWEFSNSDNMKIFSDMFDFVIGNMFIPNSYYLNILQNNWPDSNELKYDSNEILNNNSNIKNYKYRLIDSVNNHIIEKYFMIKNSLYKKSRFIDFTNNKKKLYYAKCI